MSPLSHRGRVREGETLSDISGASIASCFTWKVKREKTLSNIIEVSIVLQKQGNTLQLELFCRAPI